MELGEVKLGDVKFGGSLPIAEFVSSIFIKFLKDANISVEEAK